MTSQVSATPAAPSAAALERFARRFCFETDCWDVYDSMLNGRQDFVLLDVRNAKLYQRSHVPGAIHLPHADIDEQRLAAWPLDTLFVVYCAGPHCNGASRAALRLARLGRPVKEMIGGVTGWADEGLSWASGEAPGSLLKAAPN